MSRITKTIAEAVARQLVQTKQNEIKEIQNKEAEFITTLYEASLSQLIKEAFKKHKGFIHSTNSIQLNGAGLPQGYKYYKLSKELPECKSRKNFPVDENQATVIADYENQIEAKQGEVKELFNKIEAALINLRTYGNVQKEFPEAFALLPVSQVNTALMVNLKDIRCQLDKANC